MQSIKLSKRLQTCADFVTEGSRIADIGTDHAYILIWLAQIGKNSYSLACDINLAPLKIAENNIRKYSLENVISTRLSDGLKNINQDEVEEIIIAGMGGELIAKILGECKWTNKKEKKFILQPMTSEYELRFFLCESGYEIKKEIAVVCAGKVYTVMLVVYTGKTNKLDNTHLYVGKLDENIDKAAISYIKKQINGLKNQRKGAKIKGFTEKIIFYNKVISNLERILKKEQ